MSAVFHAFGHQGNSISWLGNPGLVNYALIFAYIWARTVTCPYTGKPIPLSPNWWLIKGSDPVAVQPSFAASLREARFSIVTGRQACST